MPDERVLEGQQWVNGVYSGVAGYEPCPEDGKPAWSTVYALTMGLQHELGISPVVANFGPGTLAALQAHGPIDPGETNENIVNIIQYALFTKGYWGGAGDGVFGDDTAQSVSKLRTDMGLSAGWTLEPKVLRALLNMNPYVLVSGGRSEVRDAQRWMNLTYSHRRDFFIVPCDGHFSRDVQKGLMLGIQYELGMADGVANGNFGPGTQSGLRQRTLPVGSTGPLVRLFSAAMLFNGQEGTFTGTFDSALSAAVLDFQEFCVLPETGIGDFQTWASLLVSTGDPTRRGTACDCVTEITPARAQTLVNAGYGHVLRYLSNVPGSTLNKKIQPGEIEVITSNGLWLYGIFQTLGHRVDYFSEVQGHMDAVAAMDAARNVHGFPKGSTIYFAVDFDALDHEITEYIIPHFDGIFHRMYQLGSYYKVGVYGPRNVCSRVAAAGWSESSFVSGMSTGYSGNLGFPLPDDWAFDQISTITIGSGSGQIEIDNNIVSRNAPFGSLDFDPPLAYQLLDVEFDPLLRDVLLADVQDYMESVGIGETSIQDMYSTTECLNYVLEMDELITVLARRYGMRKSLIQVPIFWEMRHLNILDLQRDFSVMYYHGHNPPDWLKDLEFEPLPDPVPSDCSTGPAQIFAVTAIEAHNHAVDLGLVDRGKWNPESDADIFTAWKALYGYPGQDLHDRIGEYNTSMVPLIHIYHASLIPQPAPDLDYTDEQILNLLIRYQGTNEAAQQEGLKRKGLYDVFERYNASIRNRVVEIPL